jgi:hypothetical protein
MRTLEALGVICLFSLLGIAFLQPLEFNPHNWPQMTDRQWIDSVYTFYGLQPYWKQ